MLEVSSTWTEKLLTVASAFSRARTAREVGQVAVSLGIEALGATSGALALVSSGGKRVNIVAASDLERPEQEPCAQSLPLPDRSVASDAIRQAAAVFVDSPEEHRRRYPLLADPADREGTRVAVPLLAGEHPIGFLVFGFTTWVSLPEGARSFVQALASLGTQALDRARLLDAEQRARRRLKILTDAAEAFNAPATSVRAVFEAVTRQVGIAMGDGCILRLVSPDGAWLEPKAWWAALADRHEALSHALAGDRHPIGEGFAAQVIGKGETLFLPVVDEPECVRALSKGHEAWLECHAVHGLIAAPLQLKGRVIGALEVTRAHALDPYTDEDRLLVEALAARAASAIEKARLYEEAEKEREELLAREQQARREAETASRAKDEFLAMLGHELRNPLSPMITALELMRLRGGDALERERTIVERQVQHLMRLVDDLLDVSRITRGKIQLKRRPVELSEVIATAIEMASPLLEARRHRLEADVPPKGLLVEGDPDRLAQVVANLLTNAAKYTEPDGKVQLRASREGSQVVVRVRDSGMGIAPELLPRVFDLFVQGHRTLDRSQGGLGLGLTIVRSMVEMHGGSVGVTSEGLGKGSEFTIRLPAASAAALTPRPGIIPTLPASHRVGVGRRILVVDDNQDAADALVDALRAHGLVASVAYDGPSAIESAVRFRPEAAFLDIGLPVMDGYELARQLRELLGPAVKLLALTGYGQDRDRALSRAAGFDEHLVKPVELEHLVVLIHRLFRQAEPSGAAQET